MKEPNFKSPLQRTFLPVLGLVGLFLVITLIAYGLFLLGVIDQVYARISFIFLFFWSLVTVIAWLVGRNQIRQAKAFLNSDRVLMAWDYTPAEWRQIREETWQEERGDWKVQFGCLAFLLGLAGLLTGLMVGFEEGVAEAITGGLIGGLAGGLGGVVIGAVVAGGNHLAVKMAYRESAPGQVALAPHEIYAIGGYFKGDGANSFIESAELMRGSPNRLKLEIRTPPRLRESGEEEWTILVPARLVEDVKRILPDLTQPNLMEE